MQYLDANIFLRYLAQVNPKQSQACFELFQKAGRNELTLASAQMERQKIAEVYTCDREFDRVPSIKRLEP